MAKKGERLDIVLVNRGVFESRARAQAAIMEGNILVNGTRITKAGTAVSPDSEIQILGQKMPYVSRGGLKLEKAAEDFGLTFENKTVLDIGASTGGFTDCALQRGAKKVFSVDVGYGQLAWKLRQDPRVINLERTNARYLTYEDIGEAVDLIIIDVSFISLEKVVGAVLPLLKDEGEVVALIKPQFEAGREQVGKGVVRNPQVHIEVLTRVTDTLKSAGLAVKALTFSPIRGPKGNIEYLIYACKSKGVSAEVDVQGVVEEAWGTL